MYALAARRGGRRRRADRHRVGRQRGPARRHADDVRGDSPIDLPAPGLPRPQPGRSPPRRGRRVLRPGPVDHRVDGDRLGVQSDRRWKSGMGDGVRAPVTVGEGVRMDLAIALSTRDDSTLVELTGVLDHASAPYLRQVAFTLFDGGRRHIIFELSGLRLLDAASVKVLLYLAQRAEQLSGTIQVT